MYHWYRLAIHPGANNLKQYDTTMMTHHNSDDLAYIPVPLSAQSLTLVATRSSMQVIAITTSHTIIRRLAELGLARGTRLRIVQHTARSLLIALPGGTLVLSHDIADNILVIPDS